MGMTDRPRQDGRAGNLWFANPGGSNSMPSRTHSSVQRTRSLPVHTSPQTMLMFQQPGRKQLFAFCLFIASRREHTLH
nr:PREDICTED: protein Smaug homolog 1-like [Struthio camelus australis]